MAIRFNLGEFLKAGADVAAASYEGKLQAEASQQKEQMQQLQQQRLLESIANQKSMQDVRQQGLDLRQQGLDLRAQGLGQQGNNQQNQTYGRIATDRRLTGDTEGAAQMDALQLGGTGQRAALNPDEQRQLLMQQWQQNPTLPMTALAGPENRAPAQIPGRYPFPSQNGVGGGEVTAAPDLRKPGAAALTALQGVLKRGETAVWTDPAKKQEWDTYVQQVTPAIAHPITTAAELQAAQALIPHGEGILTGTQPAAANVGLKQEAAADKPLQDRLNKIQTTLGNIGYLQHANPKMISSLLTDGKAISDKLGVPFTVPDSILTHMSEYERQHLGIMQQNADTSRGNLGARTLELQARVWRMQQIVQKSTGLSANATLHYKMQSLAEAARDYHAEMNKPLNKYDSFDVDSFTGNPGDPNYTTARARIAHLYHVYRQRAQDVEQYVVENEPNSASFQPTPPPPNWTPWQGVPQAAPTAPPAKPRTAAPPAGRAVVQERPTAPAAPVAPEPTMGTQYQRATPQQQHQMRQELRNALERLHEHRPEVIRRTFQHAFGINP